MSTIVLLTIVHDVTGSGLLDEKITTPKQSKLMKLLFGSSGSVSSFQISWLTLSSVFVIVIGLIKSYTERSVF
ncbi:unnamed protein product [Schistosoma guineensis]|nr:unnamed protein product [Schistosoma guineensis]